MALHFLLPVLHVMGRKFADYMSPSNQSPPQLPEVIHYRWMAVDPDDIDTVMRINKMLTVPDFYRACMSEGKLGQAVWARLADDLERLQRFHTESVIMLKLI